MLSENTYLEITTHSTTVYSNDRVAAEFEEIQVPADVCLVTDKVFISAGNGCLYEFNLDWKLNRKIASFNALNLFKS